MKPSLVETPGCNQPWKPMLGREKRRLASTADGGVQARSMQDNATDLVFAMWQTLGRIDLTFGRSPGR